MLVRPGVFEYLVCNICGLRSEKGIRINDLIYHYVLDHPEIAHKYRLTGGDNYGKHKRL